MIIRDIDNPRKNKRFTYNFGELRPQYNYVFSVSAAIEETDEQGQVAKIYTEYPAGSNEYYPLYIEKILDEISKP